MSSIAKPVGSKIHKLLIVFVLLTIFGDLGTVAFWITNPA
jgi:hypothetical protein